MGKPSKEYIAAQNIIVNEMGLTKDLIRGMVKKRVDKIVEKKLKAMMGADELDILITKRIAIRAEKNLLASGYTTEPFDNYIRLCIERKMNRLIDERYDITVSAKPPLKEPTSKDTHKDNTTL
jgi:hypothetical protein